MGKRRDKRRRKAKKQTLSQEIRAIQKAVLANLSGSDPILGEPDAPVYAPLKPKPHLRSGALNQSQRMRLLHSKRKEFQSSPLPKIPLAGLKCRAPSKMRERS